MDDDFKPMFQAETLEESAFNDWVVQDDSVKLPERKVELISPDELELLKKQAYDEAYQLGLNQGQSETEALHKQIKELTHLVLRPLALVEQEVQQELINLCAWLTKTILNAELNYEPQKILNIFDDLKELLPSINVVKTLYLNLEDQQLIIDLLDPDKDLNKIDFPLDLLQIDKSLTRGEYRLETIDREVDATVEARLQELVLNTLTQNDIE